MPKFSVLSFMVFALMLSISCSSGSGIVPNPADDSDRGLDSGSAEHDLGIVVAPQTMLLGSDQGGSVVVHTAIPIGLVDRTSLTLNGIPVIATKADSRGHIVCYFDEVSIKAIITPPEETMVLEGLYLTGEPFMDSDTVRVVEHSGFADRLDY